ncbi:MULTISPECIES: nucleoside diphosphate kinase regulator [unclassified Hoeflea]|jgi:regulator of nucleoside diphosphate kinase|uniref:nucleoside diphosphate kinase regulator n=1 Tax=unclassified Hoeflea TaxID=2614931 RepID=UPI002AFEE09F|nr:nucleoside diphosphate kinase regulator [Hoeflea sp.]
MQPRNRRKPAITITETDYDRLSNLAAVRTQRSPELAISLAEEIDRARIVSDAAISPSIIRMGSTVTYVADNKDAKTVQLVYPGDANIEEGRISVTTPVGSALIGLKAGQTIDWTAPNGQRHELKVLEVSQDKHPALSQ